MTRGRRHLKVAAVVAAVSLFSSACSGAPASTARAEASALPTASDAGGLIVLGEGTDGGRGLWSFHAPDRWAVVAPASAATGIARFGDSVAVSRAESLELRWAVTPGTTGTTLPIRWHVPAPTAQIVSLAQSPNGSIAIATRDGESQGYWLVAADGSIVPLQPAPTQSFTPLVAWLDDSRLLVLTTDEEQTSRLAVVDLTAQTIEPTTALAGIRVFALSGDRRYVAASTGTTLYAGPVEAFLRTGQTETVAEIDPSAVIWGLACDGPGAHVAMFSGTVAADGQVASAREVGYARLPHAWAKEFDSPALFGKPVDQVWTR